MKVMSLVHVLLGSILLLSCGNSDDGATKPTAKCYVDMGKCACGGQIPSGATAVDACEQGPSYTNLPIACCDGPEICSCTSWKCEMVGQSCGCEFNTAPSSGADTCTGLVCCKVTDDSRGACYCGATGPCPSGEEQVAQCSPGLTTAKCDFDETPASSCLP